MGERKELYGGETPALEKEGMREKVLRRHERGERDRKEKEK